MEEDTNSRPDLHGSVHMRSPDSAGGRAILHASMGGSSPPITVSTEMTLLEYKLVNKLKQLARKLRCVYVVLMHAMCLSPVQLLDYLQILF